MIKKCLSLHRFVTKKTKTLIDFWAPLHLTSNSTEKSCTKSWIAKGLLMSITVKNKLYKRKNDKTKNPFRKLELEEKVKVYKATLTKLIRINKAKHYNNYFIENKKNLLKTWDGI